MLKPILSRHGLTRCGACRAHIRAAARPSLTECPFCGANLHRALARILPTGRGGVLAASLLAFGGAACGGGDAGGDTTTVEPDDHTSSGSDTGDDNGDRYADDPADDNTAVAEYGVAPDRYDIERSEYPPDEPMYGIPPDSK